MNGWPLPNGVDGVNVFGYFKKALGLGESARLVVDALKWQGIPFSLISLDHLAVNIQDEECPHPISNAPFYRVNLFCLDLATLIRYIERHGWSRFKGCYNIALVFWETSTAPAFFGKAWSFLDEVWTSTKYVQEQLSRLVSSIPVLHIPHPIVLRHTPSHLQKQAFNLLDCFTFLFCFSFESYAERKNPFSLIKAFKQAFSDVSDVQLVLKTQNGSRAVFSKQVQRMLELIHGDKRIHWIDENFNSKQRYDLIQSCDCYISLHRSEGLGLSLGEAMLMGKPVIATGYSGNLDFMNEANSFLCEYSLVRVGPGLDPYPAHGVWANVDIGHAAVKMRFVYTHPQEALKKALKGQGDVLEQRSFASVGLCMQQRLEELRFGRKEKLKYLSYYLTRVYFRMVPAFIKKRVFQPLFPVLKRIINRER